MLATSEVHIPKNYEVGDIRQYGQCFLKGKFAILRGLEKSWEYRCNPLHDIIRATNSTKIYSWIHHIVHVDLGMKKNFAKRIPKCLNADQKRAHVETDLKRTRNFWTELSPWSSSQWNGSTFALQEQRSFGFKNRLVKFLG